MIFDIWQIIKIGYIVLLALYCGFAFMVLRQIGLMTEVLGTNLDPTLRVVARFHLVFALSLTVLAVIVL
ncbi:MAG: hypothetical protein NT141_02000 [candidate division WWE3 bacterium]|nr:hypothetical protein [candidate division WWE3 bacterium]